MTMRMHTSQQYTVRELTVYDSDVNSRSLEVLFYLLRQLLGDLQSSTSNLKKFMDSTNY